MCGISFTQVVQLVAQKLTSTTLPRNCSVLDVCPFSSVYATVGAFSALPTLWKVK
jgi:hypothetical protein